MYINKKEKGLSCHFRQKTSIFRKTKKENPKKSKSRRYIGTALEDTAIRGQDRLNQQAIPFLLDNRLFLFFKNNNKKRDNWPIKNVLYCSNV